MGFLTSNKENFIKYLVEENLSEYDAYKKAYSSSKNWSEKAIEKAVSKLMTDEDLLNRYEEVSENLALQKIVEVEKDKEEVELLRRGDLENSKLKEEVKTYYSKKDVAENLKWVVDEAMTDIKENGLKQVSSSAFFNGIKLLIEIEGIKPDTAVKIEKTKADITKVNTEVGKMLGVAEEIEDLSEVEMEIYGEEE